MKLSSRLRQSIAEDISLKLQQGTNPAPLGVLKHCSVLETKGLIVLQGECATKTPKNQAFTSLD
ncbi:hypothetical protein IQ276_018965 [Desmonostoc muscorum LEGE 12446]|uniref:Uncharacterized protein n=1 Tax=Desmonostoc muscorum LEGE 12446 TaxID=1828758 RepID=A0A8J6ZTX5_DESMC|nr:hypothetical protein [Desmonostoc muscorum]MCF2148469.1 hypothetical protein [Desmonostoc muscorum LEGE 12446]